MGVFEILSAISLVPLVGMVVTLPLAVYLVARSRDARENRGADPALGTKTALGFFQTLGFNALLAGTAAVIAGICFETRIKDLWGPIAGLVVGGLFFAMHTVLLARTNQAERPSVQRLYWGLNYLGSGAVSFVGLSMLIAAIGRGRFDRDTGYIALALTLVYLPTWIVLTFRQLRNPHSPSSPPARGLDVTPSPEAPSTATAPSSNVPT